MSRKPPANMKISKIKIENYRLLKDFSLDLETELSLVIGKNNTGKTSILSALEKFLNERQKFTCDDLNLEFKRELKQLISDQTSIVEKDFAHQGIKLRLFVEYDEKDNIANLSRVMMDLDPDNNTVVLGFEYTLDFLDYLKIRSDFADFSRREDEKALKDSTYSKKELNYYIDKNFTSYFKLRKRSYKYDNKNTEIDLTTFIDLEKELISIKDIISFKYISARRDVTNKGVDKTLSLQTSRIYERTESTEDHIEAVESFKDRLAHTDSHLNVIYKTLFDGIVGKIASFGGTKLKDSEIEIVSTLQDRELLSGNTTVVYKHDSDHSLPEHYNGLGYMNLISMIFEIEILVNEFKRDKNSKPADINLLFIEEPEAHTHPQMQYIFIKNIKNMLRGGIVRDDGETRKLQYIISTHSSCIVADSDFNDIKYLKKNSANSVVAKNIRDLEKEYDKDKEEKNYRFLKQYLTISRAELFFADKAIFIEGETERILLPAMMKKIDLEHPDNPLLSQNISIVEVGAHSHIFEKFINFIGIEKSIIITDIDTYYRDPMLNKDGTPILTSKGKQRYTQIKCAASHTKAKYVGNSSLRFFHNGNKKLDYFKSLTPEQKRLSRDSNKTWISDNKGSLLVAFQTEEKGYHARSFEDSFFHINSNFITNDEHSFPSLTAKYLSLFKRGFWDAYDFAEDGVGSKPSLAIEILLNSKTDKKLGEFSNWMIPSYIKEALLWLK